MTRFTLWSLWHLTVSLMTIVLNQEIKEEAFSLEILIYFFIDSANPIQTLTQTHILTLKKANEKCADEYYLFSLYSL